MKKYNLILLAFLFIIFYGSSCEEKKGQYFIIQNNSDMEIIIVFSRFKSMLEPHCMSSTTLTTMEYQKFVRNSTIKPHSNRNFEERNLKESLTKHPNDTLYIGVFNRIDVDTMSCEEFEQEFPLKKEWKVTLADMQAVNWTLVYTAEE